MVPLHSGDRLEEFLNQYGPEGFLQLFFTNYLYELVQHFLHSKGRGDKDTSSLYYIYQEKEISAEKIEQFEQQLKKACSKRAKIIVNSLNKEKLLEKILAKNLDDPKIAALLQENLEIILEDISEV